MRQLCLIASLLVLSFPSFAYYQLPFPTELIGQEYRAETREKVGGKLLGESRIKIGRTGNYLVIVGQSTGTYGGKKIDSLVTRYFTLNNGLASIYFVSGEVSKDGRPSQSYTNRFDWPNKVVAIDYLDREKNERKVKNVPLTARFVNVSELDLLAASLPARGLKTDKVKVLVPDGTTFGMDLKQADGQEKIDGVACYRIELKIDLGLISFVIPNVNYWVTTAKPYRYLRYAGLLGGPGSPDIVQNVVDR
jgi:hypothetical protein